MCLGRYYAIAECTTDDFSAEEAFREQLLLHALVEVPSKFGHVIRRSEWHCALSSTQHKPTCAQMFCTQLTGRRDDEGATIAHSRETPNHIAKVLVSQDVRHVLEKDVRRLQVVHETEDVLNEITSRITVKPFSLAQTAQTQARESACDHVHTFFGQILPGQFFYVGEDRGPVQAPSLHVSTQDVAIDIVDFAISDRLNTRCFQRQRLPPDTCEQFQCTDSHFPTHRFFRPGLFERLLEWIFERC